MAPTSGMLGVHLDVAVAGTILHLVGPSGFDKYAIRQTRGVICDQPDFDDCPEAR